MILMKMSLAFMHSGSRAGFKASNKRNAELDRYVLLKLFMPSAI